MNGESSLSKTASVQILAYDNDIPQRPVRATMSNCGRHGNFRQTLMPVERRRASGTGMVLTHKNMVRPIVKTMTDRQQRDRRSIIRVQ